MNLKETANVEIFQEKEAALAQTIKESLPDEIFPGSWGPVDENRRQFIVCFGWHSVEVSFNLRIRRLRLIVPPLPKLQRLQSEMPKHPELLLKLAAVKELAEVDLKHAKLTKYSSN